MPRSSYYFQDCPTCGRSLQVRVEYLGRKVVCRHCRGEFIAVDPASGIMPPGDSGIGLLRRANELLNAADDSLRRRDIAPHDSVTLPPL